MIYIIRHGQTKLNHANVLQGRSDHPLNEKGEEQARKAGAWLRSEGIVFSHVYSSPLIRAVRTAELAAPGTDIRIDERLIEMDYGPYEGADLKTPRRRSSHFSVILCTILRRKGWSRFLPSSAGPAPFWRISGIWTGTS